MLFIKYDIRATVRTISRDRPQEWNVLYHQGSTPWSQCASVLKFCETLSVACKASHFVCNKIDLTCKATVYNSRQKRWSYSQTLSSLSIYTYIYVYLHICTYMCIPCILKLEQDHHNSQDSTFSNLLCEAEIDYLHFFEIVCLNRITTKRYHAQRWQNNAITLWSETLSSCVKEVILQGGYSNKTTYLCAAGLLAWSRIIFNLLEMKLYSLQALIA